MKKLIVLMIVSTLLFASCKTQTVEGELLINHTGYQTKGMKKAVLQTLSDIPPDNFMIIDESEEVVFEGKFEKGGKIDHWHTGNAYEVNFTEFKQSGTFKAVAKLGSGTIESRFFTINNSSFAEKALELLVDGFESQHVVGKFNEKDAKMSFFGDRNDIVDVSGGWYDASGDHAKYLSHLSYANFLNPQQTPLFVWNLLESVDQYTKNNDRPDTDLKDRMLAEASYGADYLVRMQDEAGYFYLTVFANWSGDPERREICAYIGQDGKRTDEYQAAFREGGGMAIAALARASKMPNSGDFTSENYLEVAKKGFAHLLEYNVNYVDDGKENIIDDYCALLAATELYAVTDEVTYLEHARKWMQRLVNRLNDDENYKGWWLADDENRPYFHASDAGLPLITLNRYLAFETDEDMKNKAIGAVQRSIDFELGITNEVNNPFGYPRQYVKALDEDSNRGAFFIPHQNESGYWWQGENSRLASLATAFYLNKQYMTKEQQLVAEKFAANNMNWILGLNPYDVCMVDGLGYNNPEYLEPTNLNFRGGVCNGITAGFIDETDIAFMPLPQNDDPAQRWRWSEQWMPHGAWFMLAVASEN